MIICLDIGNSQIHGGVFQQDNLIVRMRQKTNPGSSSDELGIFLKDVLRENNLVSSDIHQIAFCSVVPSIDYSLRAACKKYFNIEPFVLQAGTKTGIKIKSYNPQETGADLIAGAIAATHFYPDQNLIIVGFGTVTTFTAISSKKEYLGAAFIPGMHTSMDALHRNAAKLFPVEILEPKVVIGRSTVESIQSGLYFGHLGAIKEITSQISNATFQNQPPILIGTGGFAHLFESQKLFSQIEPDLLLHGVRLALQMNNK